MADRSTDGGLDAWVPPPDVKVDAGLPSSIALNAGPSASIDLPRLSFQRAAGRASSGSARAARPSKTIESLCVRQRPPCSGPSQGPMRT